jgi:biotin carboxylase
LDKTLPHPRLLLLASKLGYQMRSFVEAAKRLGVDVTIGSDRCHQLDDPWSDGAVPLHFEQPEQAAQRLAETVRTTPIRAILALGDRQTTTAAYAARILGLRYNSPESVENCRSKLRQREVLRDAGLPVPEFFSFLLTEPLDTVLPQVSFPSVLKPLRLAASQGVIRANDAPEFATAVERIRHSIACSSSATFPALKSRSRACWNRAHCGSWRSSINPTRLRGRTSRSRSM